MLNYIWAAMLFIGIFYAALTGNVQAVSDASLSYAGDAVELCITMTGVMALWVGLMEIGKRAGLIQLFTKRIDPVITELFPDVPSGHIARDYIATNLIANILGLGWACTPAGLKAMEALSELNHHSRKASNAMCGFLILNISSLQLIPVNMIAYRSGYGSTNPTAIIIPAILATTISTLVGIICIKIGYCRYPADKENRC